MKGFSAVLDELRATRDQVAAQLADLDAGIRIIEKLNGSPAVVQPARAVRRASKTPARRIPPLEQKRISGNEDARARREVLLGLISKSEVGLTIGELRKAAPKMDRRDRQNALYTLKTQGHIKRAGNSWVKTG